MTFESSPTYAEKASLAPIRVRKRPVIVNAMYFSGGAAQATSIIDWILLNEGTATWSEAYETFEINLNGDYGDESDTETVPGQPEHLSVRTIEGTMRAVVGTWVIQGVEGEFHVCDPGIFRQTYDHI